MRILIPVPEKHIQDKNDNPFIRVLFNGLLDKGFDVIYGIDIFWHSIEYNCVFFQWPEACFNWKNFDSAKFETRIKYLKANNIIMMATCHNLHAHSNNLEANKLYEILYNYSDVIHHLGTYSYQQFQQKYPHCHHFVAQHPIYYDIAAMGLNQEQSRLELGIPIDKIVILSFGSFRNKYEENLFFSLRKLSKRKKVTLVAPSLKIDVNLYHGRQIRKSIDAAYNRLKLKSWGVICNRGLIEEKDIPKYISACDIVFIQRTEILNSGNVPLAFSGGKVVVGPDQGNVSELLKINGNPCFNPYDITDVLLKTKEGIELSKKNEVGRNNYAYAKKNMSQNVFIDTISKHIQKLKD